MNQASPHPNWASCPWCPLVAACSTAAPYSCRWGALYIEIGVPQTKAGPLPRDGCMTGFRRGIAGQT